MYPTQMCFCVGYQTIIHCLNLSMFCLWPTYLKNKCGGPLVQNTKTFRKTTYKRKAKNTKENTNKRRKGNIMLFANMWNIPHSGLKSHDTYLWIHMSPHTLSHDLANLPESTHLVGKKLMQVSYTSCLCTLPQFEDSVWSLKAGMTMLKQGYIFGKKKKKTTSMPLPPLWSDFMVVTEYCGYMVLHTLNKAIILYTWNHDQQLCLNVKREIEDTLKPVTGKVSNTDYLVTVTPVKGLGSKWTVSSVHLLEAGKTGKQKDLSQRAKLWR